MKKLFLFSIVLLLSLSPLIGQEVGEEGSTGNSPESGDVLIEITGTPFTGGSLLNFGSFRGRYFINDKIVPRLGFTMNIDNRQVTPDVVTNLSQYAVMPGVEYHLTNEGSFRSYVALDLTIGQRFASRESLSGSSVDGSTDIPNGNNFAFNTTRRGFFQFGVGVSVGAEYHFGSRFYVGTEIGLGILSTKFKDVRVDGELYQVGTVATTGSLNTINTFKIGFKLL